MLNIPLQIIYCSLSGKRRFSLDFWNCIEIALAISSFLTLVDSQKLFPSYDDEGNIIPSNGKNDIASIIKATILSVNDIFVWLRITGLLFTYKEFERINKSLPSGQIKYSNPRNLASGNVNQLDMATARSRQGEFHVFEFVSNVYLL